MEINMFKSNPKKFQRKIFLNPEISPLDLFHKFKIEYENINGRTFIETTESKHFVYTLIYYFTKKDNFYSSPLLHNLMDTKFCLEKGLIIIGGFGCGKSSILKTFQSLINENPKILFKFTRSVKAVKDYEALEDGSLDSFFRKFNNGNLIIDDLLAEDIASRFGKIDLFKDILFERCENLNTTTIITMNYDKCEPNDVETAFFKLKRYEGRVLDRLIGNFNIIQLQDKSFR